MRNLLSLTWHTTAECMFLSFAAWQKDSQCTRRGERAVTEEISWLQSLGGVQSFYWVKHHWESSCIMTGVHQNILEKTHHVSIFNITSFWGMGKNSLLKLFTMENCIERYLIFKIWLISIVLRCTFVQKGETYSFTFLKFMLKIDCLLNKT